MAKEKMFIIYIIRGWKNVVTNCSMKNQRRKRMIAINEVEKMPQRIYNHRIST